MKKNLLVVAVALLCAAAAGAGATRLAAAPQGSSGSYDYLHIFGPVNDCRATASGSTMRGAPTPGVTVLDLRNGALWCLPQDGSDPIFLSRLNLAGIPAQPPRN